MSESARSLVQWTSEQDSFLATNRFSEVEARDDLFPGITHPEYLARRRELKKEDHPDYIDVRNRPPVSRRLPSITVPELFSEADGAELWTAVMEFQKSHQKQYANEILTDVEIKVDTDHPFGVVFMSDWHIGGIGTDHESLLRDIDLINNCDQLVAYVGGDPIDNFIPEKLAHAARDSQVVNPGFQWKMFRHAIELIQPSLLAVGRGNHDGWTQRNAGIEGISQALKGIPVLHTGEDTYIDLTVGEINYVIYRKHRPIGNSRIHRTAGAKTSYQTGKRLFDVGVTEHHHEAAINAEIRHGEYRWFITTGSYKVEDAHAREWGFMHGGVGTPVVIFYPKRKKMVTYLTIEDAIEHLER